LNSLFYKIQFITRVGLDSLVEKLSQQIRHQHHDNRVIQGLPQSQVTVISTDLIYIQVRYQRWLQDPTCMEIVRSFIADEHKLSVELSTNLVNFTFNEFTKIDKQQVDIDFLQYLIAQTIHATDLDELVTDCGLGNKIFKRIVELSDKAQQENAHKNHIVGSFDQNIIESLTALSTNQAKDLNYATKILLKSRLLDTTTEIASTKAKSFVEAAFNLMLHFSNNGEPLKYSDMIAFLRADCGLFLVDSKLLSSTLIESGLIFKIQVGRNRNQDQYTLAEPGEHLIASAIAKNIYRNDNFKVSEILTYPSWIQASLIREMPRPQGTVLLKLITENLQKLSPEAVIACIDRISRKTSPEQVVDLLEWVLRSTSNVWIRTAICRRLGQCPENTRVVKILNSISNSEHAPMVRDAAFAAAMSYNYPANPM
jgi:hypothetical protein